MGVTKIVDSDVLFLVVVASVVLAKVFEAIKERAKMAYTKLTDEQREYVGYGIMAFCTGLMWFTGLNALPGFSAVWQPLGRILTCIIGGLGPSTAYDILLDKPKQPES